MTSEANAARKRILLTGATGFVGRQVAAALRTAGHDVVPVLRQSDENVSEAAIVTPDLFLEGAAFWADALKGIDAVIHSAWYAEPGNYLTSPLNTACLTGTLTLAEAVREAGVKTFIGIGTCFEYDVDAGVLYTTTPIKPLTPYAAAKASAYLMLSQLFTGTQTRFAWCRLFYLYGEGEDPRRLVPYLRDRLSVGEQTDLTSGNQIRDFMDVAEAGARIAAVVSGDAEGPLNICSGHPITVRQLAERVADEYGRRDLLNFGARPDNLIDPPCVLGIPTAIIE